MAARIALLTLFVFFLANVTSAQEEEHYDLECCYMFQNPNLPSFVLPPAQPHSPGDIILNPANPIVLRNGAWYFFC